MQGTRFLGYRTFALLIALMAFGFAGCSVNDATSSPPATVQGNFFPLENDLLYTYIRTTNFSSYDTITCRLESHNNIQNDLAIVANNVTTQKDLYSFSYTTDANGNPAAMLSTDTSSLMVLDGNLQDGATWVADDVHGIQATVIAQYDDYYLPGRQEDYTNVLEVEYHQSGEPGDTYTLRFFAAGRGLILERQIVGSAGEISRMQLIDLRFPS